MAELILDDEPDMVPDARRFAKTCMAGHADDLIGDVELVVAELVTNAALHGQQPITLRLITSPRGVRLEVQDSGRSLPMEVMQRTDAMTGRGLALVAALTTSWGVYPKHPGKVVWADFAFGPERTQSRAAPEIDRAAILAAWPVEDQEASPRLRVRLGAVPTELLLAAKAHIDNVVREMSLVGANAPGSEPLSESMARLIEAVTVDFAEARTEIKRQAVEAYAAGSPTTNLELDLPPDAAEAGERYLAALDEADRHARAARLLTVAAPTSHRVLRQWYVGSVVEQLRAMARGDVPAAPTPFAAVLAAEVDRLSRLEDVSKRLELLQNVNSGLAAATTADEMASLLVSQTARYLGVETVRVFLATDRGTLRSAAWYSAQKSSPDPYDEFSLDADLPGAAVARTGEPIVMASRREISQHFPALDGYYPDERTLHILPVATRDTTLGLLGMTFLTGHLNTGDQLQLGHALADALAQALARAALSHGAPSPD